ncbi:MAG: phosphatidate cytidylyltransferase [Oscillospiraceae bacterium]
MKNRVIVAVIGIPVLLAVIFFAPLWAWGIVVAIMASFCAWELLHCAMPEFVPRFAIYAGVCGAAIPIGTAFGAGELTFKIAAYALFVVMFAEMMLSFRKEKHVPFIDLALVFAAGIVIPFLLSALVRLGLREPKAPYLLLPFVITWLSDSGAFFVGRSRGKTKLAPALSPNKTVEGSVGGFVCAIFAAILYGLILYWCHFRVNILVMAVYGFFGSLAGQAGDLAFSAIKREHGIKDYSNLLPGHGGMLDRFDSTIFTAPILELLVLWVPAITVAAGA